MSRCKPYSLNVKRISITSVWEATGVGEIIGHTSAPLISSVIILKRLVRPGWSWLHFPKVPLSPVV